ncbi:MAG: ester cyclase [Gammaproteobacteria bacterium]|nr:ester cyclase [Gammaproteobacteria bacterium]
MSRQRAEEVMRRYLTEVVGEGKLELIDELAAEDMVDHTQTIPGRAGLVAHVKSFRERNRDVELNVERIIASDDEVVGIWTWRATHSTDMYGVPPLGAKLEVRVASIFRLRDGMVIEYEVISDALTGFRRMGADVEIRPASATRLSRRALGRGA